MKPGSSIVGDKTFSGHISYRYLQGQDHKSLWKSISTTIAKPCTSIGPRIYFFLSMENRFITELVVTHGL